MRTQFSSNSIKTLDYYYRNSVSLNKYGKEVVDRISVRKFRAKLCLRPFFVYESLSRQRSRMLFRFGGMGAAFYYLSGFEQWSCSSTNLPAMGFNGIAAAFLGGLHPIGAIFSSYFIQHITDGGTLINKSVYSSQISDLISSIIIYLCGFVLFLKMVLNNILAKKEKETANANASDTE